ncbi:hypothetical protein [Streptomyces glaucescens]|uniref:Uncharacterized protein n=1 Tax=Streptomyces glaucescens TaxID=1907 RepID=A0A089YRY4_STRGA|nr:hypothetical protein [Streptomyces glaucescens]AIR96395.1 hypothetical protein SGLAU_01835 [Streptomyces glaucescens]
MEVARRDDVTPTGNPRGRPVAPAHGFGRHRDRGRPAPPALVEQHRTVRFGHMGSGRSDPAAHRPIPGSVPGTPDPTRHRPHPSAPGATGEAITGFLADLP